MADAHEPVDVVRAEDGSEAPQRRTEPGDDAGKAGQAAPIADQLGDGAGEIAEKVVNTAQDIGEFIRAQRESTQVSLRQLAERAGVSNPYLSQIERGLRKPSAEVLAQIAKGLRVSA